MGRREPGADGPRGMLACSPTAASAWASSETQAQHTVALQVQALPLLFTSNPRVNSPAAAFPPPPPHLEELLAQVGVLRAQQPHLPLQRRDGRLLGVHLLMGNAERETDEMRQGAHRHFEGMGTLCAADSGRDRPHKMGMHLVLHKHAHWAGPWIALPQPPTCCMGWLRMFLAREA